MDVAGYLLEAYLYCAEGRKPESAMKKCCLQALKGLGAFCDSAAAVLRMKEPAC